ncbi:MAG: DUF2752 domain-containing protein [Bacteroidales bacterium]|nr:DUF2752 domain-containing protein [Bacteroidales bacterium]
MTKNKIRSLIKEPYHIINLSFAGIIILIFIYSGIFSAEKSNHPIKSACEVMTGEPCSSSGLSRSFSEIVRFNFESANEYNQFGILIFSFFLIQFFLRTLVSILVYFKRNRISQIIVIDSLTSISLYIYCFRGILFWINSYFCGVINFHA